MMHEFLTHQESFCLQLNFSDYHILISCASQVGRITHSVNILYKRFLCNAGIHSMLQQLACLERKSFHSQPDTMLHKTKQMTADSTQHNKLNEIRGKQHTVIRLLTSPLICWQEKKISALYFKLIWKKALANECTK